METLNIGQLAKKAKVNIRFIRRTCAEVVFQQVYNEGHGKRIPTKR
jgi:hypothetical protein